MTLDPTHLLGSWRFDREIEDRLAGETTRIEGRAEFSVVDDGRIRWHESGEWARPTGTVPVQRTLWIEPRTEGWFVTFEDRRDFHPWTTDHDVEHPCGRDTYVGTVTPGADREHWSLEWLCTGPEKDYTMRTTYARA